MGKSLPNLEIIVSSNTAEIIINGTPFKLERCYARVEFLVRHTGDEMDIALFTFYDKSEYLKDTKSPLNTNLNKFMIRAELTNEPLNEETALFFMKKKLVEDGFNVD